MKIMLNKINRIVIIFVFCSCAHARPYLTTGIEYLIDNKKALYVANCGFEIGEKFGMHHFLEFDAIYTEKDTLYSGGFFELSEKLLPTILSYKFSIINKNSISWTAGVGAGLAIVKQKFRFGGEEILEEKDSVACSQAFTGFGYWLNRNFCVNFKLRYINVAKTVFKIHGDGNWNDTSVGLSLCYKF